MKTFYQILGVGVLATEAEIKTAFRDRSKLLHPDCGGNTEEFQSLLNAYQVLIDPQKRAMYDLTLQTTNQANQTGYYEKEPDVEEGPSNPLLIILQFLFTLGFYALIYFGLMKLGELLHLETLAYFLYFFIVYYTFFKFSKS